MFSPVKESSVLSIEWIRKLMPLKYSNYVNSTAKTTGCLRVGLGNSNDIFSRVRNIGFHQTRRMSTEVVYETAKIQLRYRQ
jgi:hypothetical protein